MTFQILQPNRILFGRGTSGQALTLARSFGSRGIVVHGANPARASALIGAGAEGILRLSIPREPLLEDLEAAVATARPHGAEWVLAVGGGSVLDLGKALAAMIPAPGGPMDHLEVVGRGLPLKAAPLPFIAVPTTAGTGAEVTKNAVIGLPDHGRKVSLRDDRTMARVAIVDPALTDGCPAPVTLASGLDAVTQVIEPYLSCKANPFTDAIARPAIGQGMAALMRLMEGEDASARDALAFTSLSGGLALANAGLGAVHGLSGVIGGLTGAAHGAICGALLGPVLAMNRRLTTGPARARCDEVCAMIAAVLGSTTEDAPRALSAWAKGAGLPDLTQMGLAPSAYGDVTTAALSASSMKGNPVQPDTTDLIKVLEFRA